MICIVLGNHLPQITCTAMFTMIHIDACDNAMSVDYEDKNSCFIWIE